jgi:DNA polymerase/3'-5' exonuclease PolX
MSIMQLTQTIHVIPPTRLWRGKRGVQQPSLPGMEPEKAAPAPISNRQIAEVLAGIADMLEAQSGNQYRIQAYRNAARGVLDLLEPVADILARHEALPVPGLGERLRARIAELVQFGSMTINNGFCMQTLPQGVRALMAIEHIGPYTAIRLYEELEIDSPEKLWWATQQQQIRQLPGFGLRSEARLKKAAEQVLKEKKKDVSLNGAA